MGTGLSSAGASHELPRVLNASHATSIVVGIIIGSGIFLVPREMMAAVGSSVTVYAVWIVGGVLSLFGAMTYAAHPEGIVEYQKSRWMVRVSKLFNAYDARRARKTGPPAADATGPMDGYREAFPALGVTGKPIGG